MYNGTDLQFTLKLFISSQVVFFCNVQFFPGNHGECFFGGGKLKVEYVEKSCKSPPLSRKKCSDSEQTSRGYIAVFWCQHTTPPKKKTNECPLKRDQFNRKYIFQPLILGDMLVFRSVRGGCSPQVALLSPEDMSRKIV